MAPDLQESRWIRPRPIAPGFYAPRLISLSAPGLHLKHDRSLGHIPFARPRAIDNDEEVDIDVIERHFDVVPAELTLRHPVPLGAELLRRAPISNQLDACQWAPIGHRWRVRD